MLSIGYSSATKAGPNTLMYRQCLHEDVLSTGSTSEVISELCSHKAGASTTGPAAPGQGAYVQRPAHVALQDADLLSGTSTCLLLR